MKPGTVGRAVQGAELRILDDEGRILPPGEVGEVFTRIRELPDFTYHNKPDQRAAIDRDGFITSGDVGYLDADGYLFLCDRKRDMVISGGVNIYPAEIEGYLNDMDGVAESAVVGVPHPDFGEAVVAVVVPKPGAAPDGGALVAQLKGRIANFKVPKKLFVVPDLPRNAMGKLDKRPLAEAAAKPGGQLSAPRVRCYRCAERGDRA